MARRPSALPAVLGLLLTLAGVVSYFVIVLHFGARLPWVRNTAAPNLVLLGLGLALSLRAAWRTRGWLAPSLAAVGVAVSAAFVWMLFVAWVLPPVPGPAIGAPAPDFALVDQDGKTARLADFRGSPLLLVFYRGHW
jgi:cytochrome oxidase Cu insertion factor (SCO1/SenC/PrrC family)